MAETIECKHCGAAIPAESISDGELAVCEFCAALNNLSAGLIPFPQKQKEKRNGFLPDKFQFVQYDDGVEIRYRWLGKQHWGLLVVAVLWNGILLFPITGGLIGGDFNILLGLSMHIAVGLGLAYSILTGFLNQTSILIRQHGLDITHRPIPILWYRDKNVDRRAIVQVYCKQRVAYTQNDDPVYVFDVHYVEKGKNDAVLVRGLDTHEKALFIEQQIEKLYDIEDEGVAGAYGVAAMEHETSHKGKMKR